MSKSISAFLIMVNVIVFLLQLLLSGLIVTYSVDGNLLSVDIVTYYCGLTPYLIAEKGYIWQIVSYMFLHSISNIAHILFNMYALFIFGIPIERLWGGRKFLIYYFVCGVGAGIAIFALAVISNNMSYYVPTIGASGAVFGLLLAFGVLFPDTEVLLFFVIPIRARTLVILFGVLEILFEVYGKSGNVSHIGHLGGLLTGIIFFLISRKHAIRYRSKEFVATQMRKNTVVVESLDGDKEFYKQKEILEKLKNFGENALTDDEVQYVRYKEIMTDLNDTMCDVELEEYNEKCRNCSTRDICFVKHVKRLKEKRV